MAATKGGETTIETRVPDIGTSVILLRVLLLGFSRKSTLLALSLSVIVFLFSANSSLFSYSFSPHSSPPFSVISMLEFVMLLNPKLEKSVRTIRELVTW